ncbi:NADP-dependent malic enzyme [Paralimibaculum aggregatum]|uniref:NADP-dependent malic enzyme n=1 Tax=Paralimibaculum aggregatum TaxID=3036245 RepID=A0ABQ6LMY6_9RHOB|nr:NADP-dependent malic enzyme [Limibaculum sp. NKW23]GMG82558.1 NADP-dependent malic enzyme [Limibaculum sp. NKW23]
MSQAKDDALREAALSYHAEPTPGKLAIRVTKPMATQRDLSLAYSPGVADACLAIRDEPELAFKYTGKANRVAVISNGTAVLGLGNIGAAASKPVMEGKVALFKKFANIDGFDIEVNETDPQKLAEIVIALEPTFGAVNLEDIGAPACFEVERICKERMGIPVFHDDQHGTAIVVAAAAVNAMLLAGKALADVKMVSTGGGAAGIACLKLLCDMGLKRENVFLFDIDGLVHAGRGGLDATKKSFAQPENVGALDEVIAGADMFLGLSAGGVLKPEMVAKMAKDPVIFALANPTPEIWPDQAREVREDAIVATGRSDYPNQVNNVLCFPFIFRGALDVQATQITEEMKVACAEAIAGLARKSATAETAAVYRGERMVFGRDYLIPKPFDPRLLGQVAGAVARAAMKAGVARKALDSVDDYQRRLDASVFRTGMIMKPVFEAARSGHRRIVFAEGEEERVLHCAQSMLQEGVDQPILIGRPDVIASRIERAGINLVAGRDFEVCDPHDDPRYKDYWSEYHDIMQRRGVTPDLARTILRTNTTAIGAIMVRRGEADSLICGTFGQYLWHLKYVDEILAGLPDGKGGKLKPIGALSTLILDQGVIFIGDSQVHPDPSAEQIADTVVGAARHIRRFGIEPRIALLSHSVFGNLDTPSGRKMREALDLLEMRGVDFEFEGEMHADHALDPELLRRIMPNARLTGPANCLIFASVDAASGSRNILKQLTGGLEIGPILMGMGNKAHIVSPSITARGLLNIAALAGTPVTNYA